MGSECKLLSNYAITIQCLMMVCAVFALVVKRSYESPKRRLLIWMADTSKQAISASLVHFINILVSFIAAKSPTTSSGNPFSFYSLNLLFDTTIGVYILYLFIRTLERALKYVGVEDINAGHYGSPPRIFPWIKQLFVYLLAWTGVKAIVVVAIDQIQLFSVAADWVLDTLDCKSQAILVLLVMPLILNILQALLTDRILKGRIVDQESGIIVDHSGGYSCFRLFGSSRKYESLAEE